MGSNDGGYSGENLVNLKICEFENLKMKSAASNIGCGTFHFQISIFSNFQIAFSASE